MRARIVLACVISVLCVETAWGVGFLTQKELVGHEGEGIVVLPPYTYVTIVQRFGDNALINYRIGDEVRELRVKQGDLDAVRPDDAQLDVADPDELAEFYRERVPFDVYIEEFRDTIRDAEGNEIEAPSQFRIRIKTQNLCPEILANIRFEVQVYFDTTPPSDDVGPPPISPSDLLWQLRIVAARPRDFKIVQTPLFSSDTLRANADIKTAPKPTAMTLSPGFSPSKSAIQKAASPKPVMRFAVRLFVEELFVTQKTGIVRQIEEEKDDSHRAISRGDNPTRRRRIPPPSDTH